MITVIEVNSKRKLKKFIKFPNRLYKHNPYYCPTLNLDERQNLTPDKNPAWEYCDTKMFLAYKDGKLAGRISTIINHSFNEKKNVRQLRFTRFDVIDDFRVTEALFERVYQEAKENQMTEVVGPLGFCDLDREGMLIEGFEEKNMFITFYNHPYYHDHLKKLGFLKDVDWVEYQIFPKDLDATRIIRIASLVQKRYGYFIKHFSSKRKLKPYLPRIFEILNYAYEELYGVVPLTEKQVQHYVNQFLTLVNLEYVYLLCDKDEEIVGMGLMVPSLFHAMRKSKGKLFPTGWFHILRALRNPKVLDMYLIGVLPEHQGKGANALILSAAYQSLQKNNVEICETGPELEENRKVQDQWKGLKRRQHRRRRCFIKYLDEEPK